MRWRITRYLPALDCVIRSAGLTANQQHRLSSARSTSAHANIPASPTSSEIRGRSMSPETALSSHPPSSTLRRPVMAPSLSVDTNLANMDNSGVSTNATGGENGTAAPEICLSPSWSDFGGSKRRKEKRRLEREKKEMDKKQKSELEQLKAAESMAGKRLSKKPPAAMDTQKMPAALRRNSGHSFISSRSSSREDSGRPSREDRGFARLSIGSLGKRRSQSSPGTNAKLPPDSPEDTFATVSAAAPQLPRLRGFGWSSRRSSSGTNRSSSGSGGELYDKDLVQFAYSLEASSDAQNPKNFSVRFAEDRQAASRTKRKGLFPIPSFGRSRTTPDLKSTDEARTGELNMQRSALTPVDSEKGSTSDKQNIHPTKRVHPPRADPDQGEKRSQQPTGKFMSDDIFRAGWYTGRGCQEVQPSHVKSHNDGSSYVHKQRMHQQQLSIAGYQDELAIRDANEKNIRDVSRTAEGPSIASTRSASSESSKPQTPQTSMELDVRMDDGASLQEQANQDDVFLKDSKIPASASDSPAPLALPAQPSRTQPYQPSPAQLSRTQSYQPQPSQSPQVQPSQPSQARAPEASQTPQPSQPQPPPQGFKTDWILGFRPFQKTAKQIRALATPKPSASLASSGSKSPSIRQPPVNARYVQPTEKSSKADRTFAEIPPQQVNQNLPKTPQILDRNTLKENVPQRPKLETHQKTLVSSSQLLKDSALVPKSIPRSSTAPMLPVMAKKLAQTSSPEDGVVTPENATSPGPGSPTRSVPRGPRSPPADIKPFPKLPPEIVVEGVNGEGLVHKTSIKRPRSNPQLLQAALSPGAPSLDFLPQLKHQPLIKPKRTSPIKSSFVHIPDKASFPASSQFPLPSPASSQFPASSRAIVDSSSIPSSTSAPDLKLTPRSPLRPLSETSLLRPGGNPRRRTMGPPGFGQAEALDTKPVAKLFVICCKCKFWHDLPSNLYELMSSPRKLSRRDSDHDSEGGPSAGSASGSNGIGGIKEGTLDTMVQCPWCHHGMTTWCCAGWTTVVYLHERHH